MPRNRSCGSYGPGHLMHWIQGKKSHEDGQPIIKVKVVAVHDDGRVEIEGDDLKMRLWCHDPDHLRSALCFGGRAEWKPKYHVLCVISSGSFNLATLDKVKPCKPPIHRRPTETTRQFIERAMEENHGYTVPARWIADLDSIPDGDNAEPESGYLVGIETPTDPTLLEPLRSIQGIWTSPRWPINLSLIFSDGSLSLRQGVVVPQCCASCPDDLPGQGPAAWPVLDSLLNRLLIE